MCETINNKYICEYCGKSFNKKFGFTRHVRAKHLGIKYTFKINKNSKRFQKVKCKNCGRLISFCQYNQHYESCLNHKQKVKDKNIELIFKKCIIKNNRYICPICNKEFNKYGIKSHIYLQHTENGKICKQNQSNGFKNGTRAGWNKGLTKQTDKRIAKQCLTYEANKNKGLHNKCKQVWSEESRQRLRESAIRRGLGGVRQTKKILYNGVKLGSTYEIELAKDLDANNIKWNIPKRIKYFDLNNKLHYYSPDLYLPDYNIYLDPKNDFLINNINPRLGYKDSDKIKWVCEQNNIKVFILNKNQLTWKYIKENLLV